jgi:hypothetical protein
MTMKAGSNQQQRVQRHQRREESLEQQQQGPAGGGQRVRLVARRKRWPVHTVEGCAGPCRFRWHPVFKRRAGQFRTWVLADRASWRHICHIYQDVSPFDPAVRLIPRSPRRQRARVVLGMAMGALARPTRWRTSSRCRRDPHLARHLELGTSVSVSAARELSSLIALPSLMSSEKGAE